MPRGSTLSRCRRKQRASGRRARCIVHCRAHVAFGGRADRHEVYRHLGGTDSTNKEQPVVESNRSVADSINLSERHREIGRGREIWKPPSTLSPRCPPHLLHSTYASLSTRTMERRHCTSWGRERMGAEEDEVDRRPRAGSRSPTCRFLDRRSVFDGYLGRAAS